MLKWNNFCQIGHFITFPLIYTAVVEWRIKFVFCKGSPQRSTTSLSNLFFVWASARLCCIQKTIYRQTCFKWWTMGKVGGLPNTCRLTSWYIMKNITLGHNWPLHVQNPVQTYHWFWKKNLEKILLKRFLLGGSTLSDLSMQAEDNTNRLLGLTQGWKLQWLRGTKSGALTTNPGWPLNTLLFSTGLTALAHSDAVYTYLVTGDLRTVSVSSVPSLCDLYQMGPSPMWTPTPLATGGESPSHNKESFWPEWVGVSSYFVPPSFNNVLVDTYLNFDRAHLHFLYLLFCYDL